MIGLTPAHRRQAPPPADCRGATRTLSVVDAGRTGSALPGAPADQPAQSRMERKLAVAHTLAELFFLHGRICR